MELLNLVIVNVNKNKLITNINKYWQTDLTQVSTDVFNKSGPIPFCDVQINN